MTAEIGHNNPPSIAEQMLDKHGALFTRAQELIAAKDRLPQEIGVEDAEGLEKITAMVVILRKHEKAMDAARAAEKGDYDAKAKEVQNTFKPVQDQLTAIKTRCEGLINTRNRRVEEVERERRLAAAAAERAAEQERLAAAVKLETAGHATVAEAVLNHAQDSANLAARFEREATGTAADLVRTQTGAGTVSARGVLTFEIVDQTALRATLGPLGEFFTTPEIEKAIRTKINADKRAGRATVLDGVVFTAESRAVIRG